MYSRAYLISEYERILKKWEQNERVKERLPERYQEVKYKLKRLKEGAGYEVKDVGQELIMAMGVVLCGGQLGFGTGLRLAPLAYSENYQKQIEKYIKQHK